MLAHLRQHIAATLATARQATLATSGPAGLQADLLPCIARDTHLYMLVPCASDQLLNLEHDRSVVVTAAGWQVRGRAFRLGGAARLVARHLLDLPDAPYSAVIDVQPVRVTIAHPDGWGAAETIDLDSNE